jgi:hypothetical protein
MPGSDVYLMPLARIIVYHMVHHPRRILLQIGEVYGQ